MAPKPLVTTFGVPKKFFKVNGYVKDNGTYRYNHENTKEVNKFIAHKLEKCLGNECEHQSKASLKTAAGSNVNYDSFVCSHAKKLTIRFDLSVGGKTVEVGVRTECEMCIKFVKSQKVSCPSAQAVDEPAAPVVEKAAPSAVKEPADEIPGQIILSGVQKPPKGKKYCTNLH